VLTESFVNSCLSLMLNKKSKIKRSPALYRDVLEIIEFYETKHAFEIPVGVKGKLSCLKKASEMLLDGRQIDSVYDSLVSGKFKQYSDFLYRVITEDMKDNIFQDYLKQVRIRKKVKSLFENYDELDEILNTVKTGSFEAIDDLVETYEVTIKKLFSNMMESNRQMTIEAAASLDIAKDDFAHVIDMIKKKYERHSVTSTGFSIIDNLVMNGGYEPSRLYIYGGGSGSGKSTMLTNTIFKSAMKPLNLLDCPDVEIPKQGEIRRVYVYITLENTIEESLMRIYQGMFNKTLPEMLNDVANKKIDIKKELNGVLSQSHSTIVMKYFPPKSISTVDLLGVLDDVINDYGKECIAGLYVDYLDILKPDSCNDLYRIELGDIALSLKTLAVEYNIPVITASQLGRSSYRIKDSADLNLDQISESIKKVEHADFVFLMALDVTDEHKVHGKVGKNRSGRSNMGMEFTVNFEKYLFTGIMTKSNPNNAPGSDTGKAVAFSGFGAMKF
jgi:replicative DNA helicase